MNHSQLRAFHAVAAEGSFTKASTALRVAQPTLSGHVKALEEGYGVSLFRRGSRYVEITEFGSVLFKSRSVILPLSPKPGGCSRPPPA